MSGVWANNYNLIIILELAKAMVYYQEYFKLFVLKKL